MIVYKNGNLFEANEDILAHGCNCKGAFGSGVAGLMAKIHPKSKEAYIFKYKNKGWKLGEVQLVKSNNKIIANCATQDNYGNEKKSRIVYADYKAIKSVMNILYKYSKENNLSVAIPLIGAGLANGDWKIIEKIINDIFVDINISVYLYKNKKP